MNHPNPIDLGPERYLDWISTQVENTVDESELKGLRSLATHEALMAEEYISGGADGEPMIADDNENLLGALHIRLRSWRLAEAITTKLDLEGWQ